jgi:hypothetical protein
MISPDGTGEHRPQWMTRGMRMKEIREHAGSIFTRFG